MNKHFLFSMQFLLAGLDIFSLNVIFCTACYYFQEHFIKGLYFEYILFMLFLNFAWIITAFIINLYSEKIILSFEQFSKRSMQAFIYFLLLSILYLFFSHQFTIARSFTIVVLVTFAGTLFFNRFLYLFIFNYFKKNGRILNKVIIIGYNNLSKKLAGYLENDFSNKNIIGFCDEPENIHELSPYPILGNVGNTLELCKQHGVTEIYSTIAPEQNPDIYQLINDAEHNFIRCKIIPDFNSFMIRYGSVDFLNDIPLLSVREEPLEDMGNRIKKRIFDILFSISVIVFLLSWLVPLIALLIKLTSKGPVFFLQNRMGRDNKIFKVYKFRTLNKSDSGNAFKQVEKNDVRISKIGKFLRKSSMDELPQFFNVLAGDMSICGPRPHPEALNEQYKKSVDQFMIRQFLKPGITGWAQVNGARGEIKSVLKMSKRIESDLWYMENWNIWLDVKIIFLTIFNMVKGDENAF